MVGGRVIVSKSNLINLKYSRHKMCLFFSFFSLFMLVKWITNLKSKCFQPCRLLVFIPHHVQLPEPVPSSRFKPFPASIIPFIASELYCIKWYFTKFVRYVYQKFVMPLYWTWTFENFTNVSVYRLSSPIFSAFSKFFFPSTISHSVGLEQWFQINFKSCEQWFQSMNSDFKSISKVLETLFDYNLFRVYEDDSIFKTVNARLFSM